MATTIEAAGLAGSATEVGTRPEASAGFPNPTEVRAASQREHRKLRKLQTRIVLGTVAAALVYGTFIAAPRYTAETRFAVMGAQVGANGGGKSRGLIAAGDIGPAPLALSNGYVDGFAVNDFLNSRDCMQRLGKRIDLRAMLSRSGLDPAAHLPETPSAEQLYSAYRRAVKASFNVTEQINVLEVSGFAPAESERIAKELLAIAQDYVVQMDDQVTSNAVDVAKNRLAKAEQEALAVADAVAKWRSTNRNYDPSAETKLVMSVNGDVEQQLADARARYGRIRDLGNPDHPLLRNAETQVASLERQLTQSRARLTGANGSVATLDETYHALQNRQAFADDNLRSARASYEVTLLNDARMRRYLGIIAQPVAEDQPSRLRLLVTMVEGLIAGVFLAFATTVGLRWRKNALR